MGLAAVAIPLNPARTDKAWLFSLQQGERFQLEASSVSRLGLSLFPMSQLCAWAGPQPVPRVLWPRRPGCGKDSRVLLRAHLLVKLLRSLTAGLNWGIRWVIGWKRQQTVNWGKTDEFQGSVGSSGLNVHPVSDCRDGCLWHPLVPCHPAPPRDPTLQLWPLQFHLAISFAAARRKNSVRGWLKQ